MSFSFWKCPAMMRDPTGEVKLQVKLGNIQARIDSGHSVLALSCKCEQALVGRSINGSSLGHRHEWLRLPTHLAINQCQRITNSFAPLSCRLQAAGQSHLPKPLLIDKVRRKFRYKRARERCRSNKFASIRVIRVKVPVLKSGPSPCCFDGLSPRPQFVLIRVIRV